MNRDRTRLRAALVTAALSLGVLVVADGTAGQRTTPTAPHEGPSSGGALVARWPLSHVVDPIQGKLAYYPTDAWKYSDLQFTADGRGLAYVDTLGRIVLMDVRTGATRVLATCPDRRTCAFAVSPEGNQVVVGDRHGDLVLIGDGSRIGLGTGRLVAWSPNGDDLLVSVRGGLDRVLLDGSTSTSVFRVPDTTVVSDPAWSPDGRSISFIVSEPLREPERDGSPWPSRYSLWVANTDGSGAQSIQSLGTCYCIGISSPTQAWSPDGRLAFTTVHSPPRRPAAARTGSMFTVKPDGTDLRALGVSGGWSELAWQPSPAD